jgi:DNA end-binding protein Ku
MPRPLWSGTVQISLVSFAIEVYPAADSVRPISFHEVDRRTMGRVHRQNISSGWAETQAEPATSANPAKEGKPAAKTNSIHLAARGGKISSEEGEEGGGDTRLVEKTDIVKSFEYEKGKYAIIEPEELKDLRLAGKRTIEIAQFAKLTEINPVLYEKPYFAMPKKGPQAKAFAVIRQSMIDSGKAAIGEIVFSGRQHLMALAPPHDVAQPGMMLFTLRFATELRDVHNYPNNADAVKPDISELGLAKQLIDAYTRPFKPAEYRDHYEQALRELIEAKIHHELPAEHEPAKQPGKVIDLMEALQKSLEQRKNLVTEKLPSQNEPAPGESKKKPVGSARKATSVKKNKPA